MTSLVQTSLVKKIGLTFLTSFQGQTEVSILNSDSGYFEEGIITMENFSSLGRFLHGQVNNFGKLLYIYMLTNKAEKQLWST